MELNYVAVILCVHSTIPYAAIYSRSRYTTHLRRHVDDIWLLRGYRIAYATARLHRDVAAAAAAAAAHGFESATR